MNSSFLKEKLSPIIMIILGIIALLYPIFSVETLGFLNAVLFVFLAAGFIVAGITELTITKYFGFLYILCAIICMIFTYYLIFDPAFVSGLVGFMIYVFGFLLIFLGTMEFIIGPIGIMGIITFIYGFLTIILAYLVNDPKILGTLVGLWLIVSGIVSLFADKE